MPKTMPPPSPWVEEEPDQSREPMDELWPDEFDDVLDIVRMGAKKYAPWDWLTNPSVTNTTENSKHMMHHLIEYTAGVTADDESRLHPLLHLACRALMAYTVYRRSHPYERVDSRHPPWDGVLEQRWVNTGPAWVRVHSEEDLEEYDNLRDVPQGDKK